ncbi:MAG: hypothetical protein WBE37_28120 [Bryobacteraceae bacterium]
MGSVASSNTLASTNNGLSDLLQTLTNENSPLLSTLSSPNIQAALENAPASDIVEISDQAQQLQATDALFGISNTSTSPTDSLFSALASVGSDATSSATGSSLDPGSSLADQLAAYQGNMQTQETQALFDTAPSTTVPNSLYDVLG